MQGGADAKKNREQTEVDQQFGKDLTALLLQFFSASFPQSIQHAASRCLAELSILYKFEKEDDNTILQYSKVGQLSKNIENNSLVNFTQKCVLDAITTSITMSDSRIALIAADTLNMLKSITGLSTKTAQRNMSDFTPLLVTENKYVANDKIWCWDDSLWIHDAKTSSFQTWICNLVPALISCCYYIRKKDNLFYAACHRISTLDFNVASKLFPAIILDLLLRDGSVDGVVADAWVGQYNGELIKNLSLCIGTFLQNQQSNSRSVEIILELLDMLRLFTQYHFIAGRKNNNNNSVWHGSPFGIVLELDVLVVAKACLKFQRFEYALYYSELYANSRFGGPLQVAPSNHNQHQETSNQMPHQPSRHISGFCSNVGDQPLSKDDNLYYWGLLRQCDESLSNEDFCNIIDRYNSIFATSLTDIILL